MCLTVDGQLAGLRAAPRKARVNSNQGFFIAQKLTDGSPGCPIGNDAGAIMMFEDLVKALDVKRAMEMEHGPLSVFAVNMSFCGEVVA